MSKARRQYSEGVGRRHMHQLRDDLNDVQRIMMDNIDDVLQRGTALHGQLWGDVCCAASVWCSVSDGVTCIVPSQCGTTHYTATLYV